MPKKLNRIWIIAATVVWLGAACGTGLKTPAGSLTGTQGGSVDGGAQSTDGGAASTDGGATSGGTGTDGGMVASDGGPTPIRCGGIQGLVCPPTMVCDVTTPNACNGADLMGECIVKPVACTKELVPVCGCDGVTYDNDCMRQEAGAQLDHEGACSTLGASCGFRGRTVCDAGQFCNQPEHCGRYDAPGVCEARPEVCTRQYAPVCGCDGETYGNDCMAAAAGVSIEHDGRCANGQEGDSCGGRGMTPCTEGLYCQFGSDCGATDAAGTCQPQPDACTEDYTPVCGCDGRTYSNACTAAAAGVSVVHDGECAGGQQGAACGERGLVPCTEGLYCNFGSDCGASDLPGSCQPQPTICNREYAPVCGCDGQTYGNTCTAAAAGVSVLHSGECR